MEFGPYQLQIIVSVVVVLGAVFVALIVDYLKGNNEQLRELGGGTGRCAARKTSAAHRTLLPQPMTVGPRPGPPRTRSTRSRGRPLSLTK